MKSNNFQLPVNEDKVIDKTIDVYLYMCDDLNTAEVVLLGYKLVALANRRATDVELYYIASKQPVDEYSLEGTIWDSHE